MDFVQELMKIHEDIGLTMEHAERIVSRAKMFYYSLSYPYERDVSEEDRPIVGFVAQQWILAACEEIIERLGISSAVGYKENGMSVNYDSAQISAALSSMLTPSIGVVRWK